MGRFMILCFFIRKNSVYLQSRPPSSRDVFHRRRQWQIQTMKNAEGWHAKDVTEGVVSLRAGVLLQSRFAQGYSFSLASLDRPSAFRLPASRTAGGKLHALEEGALWGVLRFLAKQPDSLSYFFYQRSHRFVNYFTYGFKMSINFGVRKTNDSDSIFFKTGCSAFIICLSFVRKMLAAVQFNHQFHLCAIKIRNKSSDCFLSLKPNWILA